MVIFVFAQYFAGSKIANVFPRFCSELFKQAGTVQMDASDKQRLSTNINEHQPNTSWIFQVLKNNASKTKNEH